MGGNALEDGVEDTTDLAGGDEIDEQGVEDRGVALERLGEGRAGFDIILDLLDNRLEEFIILLAPEDVEALDDRQPGIDHGSELAGEDDELVLLDPAEHGFQAAEQFADALLLDDFLDLQLLALEVFRYRGFRGRFFFTFSEDAGFCGGFPLIDRHGLLPWTLGVLSLQLPGTGLFRDFILLFGCLEHVLQFDLVRTAFERLFDRDLVLADHLDQRLVEGLHAELLLAHLHLRVNLM